MTPINTTTQTANMKTERQLIYTAYERIWHWLQAFTILVLLLTGVIIHAPTRIPVLPFDIAVVLHNVLGFLLLANAALGAFYYISTGTIRQYMPEPRGFITLAVRQAKYYMHGIFHDEPHPLEKSPTRRLNPLQQVTYLIILNVLLPLQMVTGLLMWSGQKWPQAIEAVGGLAILGAIHTIGAWLFTAFLITHIYLTTTGHTPLSNIKAMIFGYEDVPVHAPHSKEEIENKVASHS